MATVALCGRQSFLGYTQQSFESAAHEHQRVLQVAMLANLDEFQQQFVDGDILEEDLIAVIGRVTQQVRNSLEYHGVQLEPSALIRLLNAAPKPDKLTDDGDSFSAFVDSQTGSDWKGMLREEAAKWCAAYDDDGQSSWKFPWQDGALYAGWRAAAQIDRNPELHGLPDFRAFVRQLPEDPHEFLQLALSELGIPEARIEPLCYRLLMTLPGWSGHLRYKDREREIRGERGDLLPQLLAILLAYELALYQQVQDHAHWVSAWHAQLEQHRESVRECRLPLELALRFIWQSAREEAYARQLKAQIQPTSTKFKQVPDVQAVFCMDVRSERYRRALESSELQVDTMGYAGFFGLPIDHRIPGEGESQARCPVLFAPPLNSTEHQAGLAESEFAQLTFQRVDARESKRTWKRFKEAASSCFTFVETMGLSYGYELVKDAFSLQAQPRLAQGSPMINDPLSLEQRIDWAQGILQSLSLTSHFAPIILFCGHGSQTRNNPYASALDCGACGGHAGDANARLAADLLNQDAVRAGLKARGLILPEETFFIAGFHNTTTDEVELFKPQGLPADRLQSLESALRRASELCATERAASFFALGSTQPSIEALRARGRDWSQVRPEWALAGNAAFVVAPRAWTRSADFSGRVFLHDYVPDQDADAEILSGIMGGPMVVGSWINLQYYASSIDNKKMGSGHKAIHNVVGGVGVAEGNECDLRRGLAFQSVHDGQQLVHKPLRLLVCVAAHIDRLDQIIGQNDEVRNLVENGWVHLIALGTDGRQWKRRMPEGVWLDATD